MPSPEDVCCDSIHIPKPIDRVVSFADEAVRNYANARVGIGNDTELLGLYCEIGLGQVPYVHPVIRSGFDVIVLAAENFCGGVNIGTISEVFLGTDDLQIQFNPTSTTIVHRHSIHDLSPHTSGNGSKAHLPKDLIAFADRSRKLVDVYECARKTKSGKSIVVKKEQKVSFLLLSGEGFDHNLPGYLEIGIEPLPTKDPSKPRHLNMNIFVDTLEQGLVYASTCSPSYGGYPAIQALHENYTFNPNDPLVPDPFLHLTDGMNPPDNED